MARAALALVELRHERHRHAFLRRDLLGAELVDRVVVACADRGPVTEVDLVLAEVALALRALHVHARAFHRHPDAPDQRLDARGVEQRVVDAVGRGFDQVSIAGFPSLAIGALEDHELELGADQRVQAALAQALELSAQDLPGRNRDRLAVLLECVRQHHRRAGLPRHQAKRREVGLELEVAEASIPARQPVALLRRHVDVGREQVFA